MRIRNIRSTLIIAAVASAAMLAGCSQSASKQLDSNRVNVVASFYPLYDFSKKIGGEHVNVINVVPAGVEAHDWTPKSRDLQLLNNADVFVYEGAGFEGWVDDVLKSIPADGPIVVEASHNVPLLKLEEAEEDGHGHGDEEKSDEHAHGEEGVDPHIWLSPSNAKIIGDNIKEALIKADPAHKAEFEANYKSFTESMDALDAKYKEQLGKVKQKELVTSHQSFGYLCRDYGLTQMPIMGLSPDAEPTAQQMKNITTFIKEHQVRTIFFEELVSDKLAKTLAKDAGVETAVLNPLEGLTEEQQKNGEDYVSIMEKNLQQLVKALQ
ncbi:metal ABC transporter substrate-binding protein [Paenibacillus chartarius]|uniref:Metal ABC transporter substrate-binding protein n=1 Tax=Paenibacillus chartarius TaxID=747481 RepID=A0ABV6DQJ1_9BACL